MSRLPKGVKELEVIRIKGYGTARAFEIIPSQFDPSETWCSYCLDKETWDGRCPHTRWPLDDQEQEALHYTDKE